MKKITRVRAAFLIILCLIGNLTACGSSAAGIPEVQKVLPTEEVMSTGEEMLMPETYDDRERVAVETNKTIRRYDEDGGILFESVSKHDENGNELSYQSVYYNAEGEVSSTYEHNYDENGNQTEEKRISYDSDGNISEFSHEKWEYDAAGHRIEDTEYDENGKVAKKTTYEYDAKGNQIKENNYDKDGYCERWVEIEYDDAGNETKWECRYKYGTRTMKRIYIRDEQGKQIEYIKYDDGNITEREEYERDENGNVMKSFHYGRDGNIAKMYEYEYDEAGREIRCICYGDDGTVWYWYESAYDGDGNEIKFESYDNRNAEHHIDERTYDESGRIIYKSHKNNGVVTVIQENEYDADGNVLREMQIEYDSGTGQKTYEKTYGYAYDEKGNMVMYDAASYEEEKTENLRWEKVRWEKEYDENGRGTDFSFYDNEEQPSYQSQTEYDENGLMVKYMGYGKNGDILIRRENEYDESGNLIRENYYDTEKNLTRHYENTYDGYGNITRQVMYEDGVLRAEKQMEYTYRFLGDIDREAVDDTDNDMAMEAFTRFLNEEENKSLEYTFLDMTGDGIEELLISYDEHPDDRLLVIQYSHGMLNEIFDIAANKSSVYLVKYNGRTGICQDYYVHMGEDRNYYYYLDGKEHRETYIDAYERLDETGENLEQFYCMNQYDGFEERSISKGEYYDIKSGMGTKVNIDWQK